MFLVGFSTQSQSQLRIDKQSNSKTYLVDLLILMSNKCFNFIAYRFCVFVVVFPLWGGVPPGPLSFSLRLEDSRQPTHAEGPRILISFSSATQIARRFAATYVGRALEEGAGWRLHSSGARPLFPAMSAVAGSAVAPKHGVRKLRCTHPSANFRLLESASGPRAGLPGPVLGRVRPES